MRACEVMITEMPGLYQRGWAGGGLWSKPYLPRRGPETGTKRARSEP